MQQRVALLAGQGVAGAWALQPSRTHTVVGPVSVSSQVRRADRSGVAGLGVAGLPAGLLRNCT